MNKLHGTNELPIHLPNNLGPLEPGAVITPTDEHHQTELEATGWFSRGEELPAKPEPIAKVETAPDDAAKAEAALQAEAEAKAAISKRK